MENLIRDLRFAVRVLLKSPGFTAAAVLCLALGIGANSAVFSVIQSVLLRALPFENPDRIVLVWGQPSPDQERQPASGAELMDYRKMTGVFDQVSGAALSFMNVAGEEEAARVPVGRVSPNFLALLGLRMPVGRAFSGDEDEEGKNFVALLSDSYWRRHFGGDKNVLGKRLTIADEPYEIIGVLPRNFEFALGSQQPDLLIPLVLNPARVQERVFRGLTVAARLAPGVSLERAQAEVEAAGRRFREQFPRAYPETWQAHLVTLEDEMVGGVRPVLLVLFAAVALVLLIACVNVANLTLARATSREKEVALRTSLGASRGSLARQFLVESLLLALCGGAVGLLGAWWALRSLVALRPDKLPRVEEIGLDLRGVAFTVGLSLLSGIAFGLVPALRAARPNLHGLLKEGGKTSSVGTSKHPLRSALVVLEVGLALVVLVGAGLVIRSFTLVQKVDLGFRPEKLLTLQIKLPPTRYPNPPERAVLVGRLTESLRQIPGVQNAAIGTSPPLGEIQFSVGIGAEGLVQQPGEAPLMADWRGVTPDYFATLKVPMIRGRAFTDSDQASSPQVAIVDQKLATRLWPDRDALGQRVRIDRPGGLDNWFTVVGVVGHVRAAKLDVESGEQIYTAFAQTAFSHAAVVLRTAGDPLKAIPALRQAVLGADPTLPVEGIRTMEETLDKAIAGRRTFAFLLGAFAAVALILVIVGVYGVMAYSVAQRVQEIGIRMAIGADHSTVVGLIVRQGLALAGSGVALGLVSALLLVFLLSRFVAGLLFGIKPTDLATFVVVSLLVTGLAALASWLPARKATRVDPMIALRRD